MIFYNRNFVIICIAVVLLFFINLIFSIEYGLYKERSISDKQILTEAKANQLAILLHDENKKIWIITQTKDDKVIKKWLVCNSIDYLQDRSIKFICNNKEIKLQNHFSIMLIKNEQWFHPDLQELLKPIN